MLDKRKERAILAWLECSGIKVDDISELECGAEFLKLLSTVDPDIDIENIRPSDGFQAIEDSLCGIHSSLPHHFLVPPFLKQRESNQLVLATTAVLVLSALFVRAASTNAKHSVNQVMALEGAVQEEIKELLQIVTSHEDDVLQNLRRHLQVPSDMESPVTMKRRLKCRKSQSFTFSPSMSHSPLKRMMASPVSPQTLLWNKDNETRRLRQQLSAEEVKVMELEKEVADLQASAAESNKEIASLKTEVQRLRSNAAMSGESDEEVEGLRSRIAFMNAEIHRYQGITKDYDDVIRENISLKATADQHQQLRHEIRQLKTSLSEMCTEKLALEARIAELSQMQSTIEAKLEERNKEVEAFREFFYSKSPHNLQSPHTPATPVQTGVSYFTELCHTELEETKDRFRAMENANADLREEVQELQGTVSSLQDSLRQLNNMDTALNMCLKNVAAEKLLLKEELDCYYYKTSILENHLSETTDTLASLHKENEELQKRANNGHHTICELRKEITNLSDTNGSLRKQLERALEQVQMMSCTVSSLELNLQEKTVARDQIILKCNVLQRQVCVLKQENEQLVRSSDQLQKQNDVTQHTYEECKNQLESVLVEYEELKQQVHILQESLAHLTCEKNSIQRNLDDNQEEKICLVEAVFDFKGTLEDLTKRIHQKEAENEENIKIIGILAQERAEHQRAKELVEEALKNARQKLEEHKRKCIEQEQHLDVATQERSRLSSQLKAAILGNGSMEERRDEMMSDIASLEVCLKEIERENNTLQERLCEAEDKYKALVESSSSVQHENAVTCHSLEEAKHQLSIAENKCNALRQDAHHLEQTVVLLMKEKDLLQAALAKTEAQRNLLGEQVMALPQAVEEQGTQLHASNSAAEKTASSHRVAAESSRKTAFEDCPQLVSKLQQKDVQINHYQTLSNLTDVAFEENNVQASFDGLQCERHTLHERLGTIECEVRLAQGTQDHSDVAYCKHVEEEEQKGLDDIIEETVTHANEDTAQFEELAVKYEVQVAPLRESALRAKELEDEQSSVYQTPTSATTAYGQVKELKLHLSSILNILLEMDDSQEGIKYNMQHLQTAVVKCKDLREANKKLTAELQKEKNEKQKMSSGLSELQADMESTLDTHEKARKDLIGQRDLWKFKHDDMRAFLEKREVRFSELTSEMKKGIAEANADMQQVKNQISDQCDRISKLEDEKDRAVREAHRLKAQLHKAQYLKDEVAGPTLCPSPSENRVPDVQGIHKCEIQRTHSASFTQTAPLSSSIFSESRFTCEEEQDVFVQTSLSELKSVELNLFNNSNELQRKNRTNPRHLCYYYLAETQHRTTPSTSLKNRKTNISVYQPTKLAERLTVSNNDGNSVGTSNAVKPLVLETPRTKSARGTPSTLHRFLKRRFHKQ